VAAGRPLPPFITLNEDHFLAAHVLPRFNLSINRRSEAEHLERTTPISDSFFLSMAASAAPSRSLIGREELSGGVSSGDVTGAVSLTWWPGEP